MSGSTSEADGRGPGARPLQPSGGARRRPSARFVMALLATALPLVQCQVHSHLDAADVIGIEWLEGGRVTGQV